MPDFEVFHVSADWYYGHWLYVRTHSLDTSLLKFPMNVLLSLCPCKRPPSQSQMSKPFVDPTPPKCSRYLLPGQRISFPQAFRIGRESFVVKIGPGDSRASRPLPAISFRRPWSVVCPPWTPGTVVAFAVAVLLRLSSDEAKTSIFYLPPRPLALALLTVARPLARPTPRPRALRLLNMGAFLETRADTLVTGALFFLFLLSPL